MTMNKTKITIKITTHNTQNSRAIRKREEWIREKESEKQRPNERKAME